MIADYVMKSIDNLFSDKLFNSTCTLSKHTNSIYPQTKNPFNKEAIKNALPTIIRRDPDKSRSPNVRKSISTSPISKSRLKTIL